MAYRSSPSPRNSLASQPRSRRTPRLSVTIALLPVLLATSLVIAAPETARADATALQVPPAGGLTQGVAGTSDPAAVVSAQSFPVETVSMLVPSTQQWLVYVPGAPAGVSTLTSETLTPESVVTLRRAGVLASHGAAPQPPDPLPEATGQGTVLDTPTPGGLVQGVAGTNDPETLVSRQGFPVETVSVLDAASQTWLVYIPSAPAAANTLHRGMMDASTIVTLRRRAPAATPTPAPTPAPTATPSDVNATAESVLFASINEERAAAGLPALTLDPAMTAVARAHSRDMLARDFFAHDNPDGLDPFERMRAAGIEFGYAAENIVQGETGASAHATLMASQAHRDNILGERYRRAGIGAITRPGGGVMVTEVFAD